MRKTLIALSIFGIAGAMGPEALAVCEPAVPVQSQISQLVCADDSEVSALAYQVTDPTVTHTGTEDIACEERDLVRCFAESGSFGDDLVTIETDWANAGTAGCPVNATTAERILIVVQASDGNGILVSLGGASYEMLGAYVLEMAHPYIAEINTFLPLGCDNRTGRPTVVAQSANPGNTFTLALHLDPPLVHSDCDPGSGGLASGVCLDDFQSNSAVGSLYTSVQACGVPADLRPAAWTKSSAQPDANGDATITVTPPTDGRCLLIGSTSIIGGFESGAITGFIQFDDGGCHDADADGFSSCVDDCNDNDPGIHPGATETCNLTDDDCDGITDEGACDQSATDIFVDFSHAIGKKLGVVTWRTVNEVDIRGFNVVVIASDGTRIQQNTGLLGCEQCRTGLGAGYAFVVQRQRSGRNIFIEVVHLDGTVNTFGPAVRP